MGMHTGRATTSQIRPLLAFITATPALYKAMKKMEVDVEVKIKVKIKR
jgi:hypothetical protein